MSTWHSLLDPSFSMHANPPGFVGSAMGKTAGKVHRKSLIRVLLNQIQRRRAIAELESLSDQLLGDIGLMRHQVPEVVDRMLTQENRKRAADSTLAA